MIALPQLLDQVVAGRYQAALLRTPDGLRLYLQDGCTGQDVWLSPAGARTLSGVLALHPFSLASVPLGDHAFAQPGLGKVVILQDSLRIVLPTHALRSVCHLLDELDRTRLLLEET